MKKILKREVGWYNLRYDDKMFLEKNNNWFIVNSFREEDNVMEKLSQDKRVINNEKWGELIISKEYIDDIEKEYNIECDSILYHIDASYGDWESNYDDIGEEIGIDEDEAYKLVGNNIAEIIETITLKINDMTEEQIKEVSCNDITFIEYGLFFKLVYEDMEEKLKSLKDKYKKFINA